MGGWIIDYLRSEKTSLRKWKLNRSGRLVFTHLFIGAAYICFSEVYMLENCLKQWVSSLLLILFSSELFEAVIMEHFYQKIWWNFQELVGDRDCDNFSSNSSRLSIEPLKTWDIHRQFSYGFNPTWSLIAKYHQKCTQMQCFVEPRYFAILKFLGGLSFEYT